MTCDPAMIAALRDLNGLLHTDSDLYCRRQEELAARFHGKEKELEDIIYDGDDNDIRLEAMMICKLMPDMERLRIYEDLWVAEKDPELRHWAGVLFRQEHLLATAGTVLHGKHGAEPQP